MNSSWHRAAGTGHSICRARFASITDSKHTRATELLHPYPLTQTYARSERFGLSIQHSLAQVLLEPALFGKLPLSFLCVPPRRRGRCRCCAGDEPWRQVSSPHVTARQPLTCPSNSEQGACPFQNAQGRPKCRTTLSEPRAAIHGPGAHATFTWTTAHCEQRGQGLECGVGTHRFWGTVHEMHASHWRLVTGRT